MEADASVPTSWFVAYTKPRSESLADWNLNRQGYASYVPMLRIGKSPRGPNRQRYEPLFPRYVFFRPRTDSQSIGPVRSTLGIARIVRFGESLAIVSQATVEGIRRFESHQNSADSATLRGISPGKVVRIAAGALAGLEGLVAMVSRERVTVLMRLLSQDTRVLLDCRELELVT